MPLRRPLFLETLETRDLMAGNVRVTSVDGVLTVRGDNQSNSIAITQVAANTYKVAGNATLINGQASANFTATDKIFVATFGGNDQVTLGEATKVTTVPLTLQMNLGAGADTLTVTKVQGTNATLVAGAETENDVDVMNMQQSTFTGATALRGGGGDDSIRYSGNRSGINGVRFNAGAGNDQLNIVNSDVTDAKVFSGTGNDKLRFGGKMKLHNTFFADGGDGDDLSSEVTGTTYDTSGLTSSDHPAFETWGASF